MDILDQFQSEDDLRAFAQQTAEEESPVVGSTDSVSPVDETFNYTVFNVIEDINDAVPPVVEATDVVSPIDRVIDGVFSVDIIEDDVHNVFQTTGIAISPIVQATVTFTSVEAVPHVDETTDVVHASDVLDGQASVDNIEDDNNNVFPTTDIAVSPIVQTKNTSTSGEAVPHIGETTDVVHALDVLVGQATDLTSADIESIENEALLNARKTEIHFQRQQSRKLQMKQAERMVKRRRVELSPGQKGDNVAIPIPLVDQGRGDPRNILAVILKSLFFKFPHKYLHLF